MTNRTTKTPVVKTVNGFAFHATNEFGNHWSKHIGTDIRIDTEVLTGIQVANRTMFVTPILERIIGSPQPIISSRYKYSKF